MMRKTAKAPVVVFGQRQRVGEGKGQAEGEDSYCHVLAEEHPGAFVSEAICFAASGEMCGVGVRDVVPAVKEHARGNYCY